MSQLICRNLNIGYEGTAVTENISFTLEAGDYLCILGKNGAGKTTLMRTILGLLPAISGEITFADGVIPGEIGYMPQQTPVQKDFPATVFEIVISGCLGKSGKNPFYRAKQKEAALENMKKLGIDHLRSKSYRKLSGGQQQRVLLARALCAASKMLLLDEPASGLDPLASDRMYSLIKELNDSGMTIIMITHDLDAAKAYANKTIHMGKEDILYE